MKIVVTEAMPTQCAEASTTEANIPQVVLITGAKSQLAQALLRIAADIVELAINSNASENTSIPLKLYALSRSQLDITDAANIAAVFDQYRPSWVINCAAYNAVDAAEHDAIEANRVNALGPELLAQQCLLSGARLLHVSSDYVFGGHTVCDSANAAERAIGDARESGVEQHQNPDLASNPNPNLNLNLNPNQVHLPRPFVELDAPEPLSAYGTSKLLGEQRVVAVLGDCATIVRTSWLYGQDGHNFVKTMLNLMRTQPSLQVIADQIGCPTWSDALARVMWQLVVQQCSGVFHYSAQGQCSWYEFASEIQRQALALNLLSQPVVIQPITSADYAKQALNRGISLSKRPSYSVLNSGKLRSTLVTHNALLMPEQIEWLDWRQQLNCMLRRLS
ncbi:sugar nucleotide-binding protein [Shewanella baltica]|uniref:SDR family oxidoreductase n=1 Tax=Shewanella baltica TaxID=62322 RepID=UPI00217D9EBB|nr:NAD(P)-dependent oxidoreductase [Shewanella baltica]MCS6127457.1 sugar nucleotide-binding protein [Shewanella baltica]MCS6139657.1 sugar nucleotide-binding protein [Shewanella baltica]MCS6145798.1 sugar nucleotide-binding protein [Shewanella baltica]MCS6170327.1 sugar nucleotide-binding protein [Shewanella baltica]MCS6187424.1 sugar nucleotide-binding protein [Shewanella baltica]